jgi:hypothetical protein
MLTYCDEIIPGWGGTISATIDGEEKKFNYDVFAEWRYSKLFIYGKTYSDENSRKHHGEVNILIIASPNSVSAKTYDANISYVINYEGYAEEYFANVPISISETNSKYIKGTFSGNLIMTDDYFHKSKELTNVNFDVKFD